MEEPENKKLSPISVKLVATRCINKFSRKVKKEHQVFAKEKFDKILDQLTMLLESTSFECMYLPIEAFT
jgi:hypothetical protein